MPPAMPGSHARVVYLDFLKTLAITMVCIYHLSLVTNLIGWINPPSQGLELQRFVWGMLSPCVPLFFTVTGTLMLSRPRTLDFNRQIRKIIRMVSQFLIWQAITILIVASWKGIDLRAEGLGTLISSLFFYARGIDVSLHHLWFIPSYIAVIIILPLFRPLYAKNADIDTHSARRYGLMLLVLLALTFFVLPDLQRLAHYFGHRSIVLIKTQNFLPFAGMTAVMFTYAMLGGYLGQVSEKLNAKVPFAAWPFLFIIGAALLLVRWNCECYLTGKTWDSVYEGYATTGTLLMTISIYIIASKIRNEDICSNHPLFCRAVKSVGENSLTVYYLHWIIIYTVWQLLLPVLLPLPPVLLWILSILKGIVLVILCVAIGTLMRKIPFVRFLFKQ